MATSMRSYGMIDAHSRCLFMINAEPGENIERLIVVNLSPTQEAMIQDGDDTWCLLINDGPAYSTFWMEITTNRGQIACARFTDGSQEFDDEEAMEIARLIVWYESESESLQADGLSEDKIKELPVMIREKGKEEEEGEGEGEICVVCLKEYEEDETIGTIKCGHVFHERCIKQWLMQKNSCPICRSTAFS